MDYSSRKDEAREVEDEKLSKILEAVGGNTFSKRDLHRHIKAKWYFRLDD